MNHILQTACILGDVERVKELIANGENVNDWTTLYTAYLFHKIDVVELLLSTGGANPNLTYSFENLTLMHLACADGSLKTVKLLLRHGANLNPRSSGGYTPLDNTKRCGHQVLVEYLTQVSQYTALYALFGPDISRDLFVTS